MKSILRNLARIAPTAGIVVLLLFSVLPPLALLLASFLPDSAVDSGVALRDLWGGRATFRNYAFWSGEQANLWRPLLNTVIVSLCTTLVVLVLTVPSAYAVAIRRPTVKGTRAEHVRVLALLGCIFPPIVLVVPYTELLKEAHLYDTLFGLVLAHIAFCLPFGIWLMAEYMESMVPRGYHMSAAIDGAAWWDALWFVVLPRAWPGVCAVGLFTYVLSWNDVGLGLLLTEGSNRPLGAAVAEELFRREQQIHYGGFAAASVLIVTAIAFVNYRVQRSMMEAEEKPL